MLYTTRSLEPLMITPTTLHLVYALTNVYPLFSFKPSDRSRYNVWGVPLLTKCLDHKPENEDDQDCGQWVHVKSPSFILPVIC